MSKRKKKFNDGPLVLQHRDKWKELAKPAKNDGKFPGTFCGARIIPGMTNQLWRWDTLEEVDPATCIVYTPKY